MFQFINIDHLDKFIKNGQRLADEFVLGNLTYIIDNDIGEQSIYVDVLEEKVIIVDYEKCSVESYDYIDYDLDIL